MKRCHYCKRKTASPWYFKDELYDHEVMPHSITPNPDALPLCELTRRVVLGICRTPEGR